MITATCKTCRWWGKERVGACGIENTINTGAATNATRLAIYAKADDDSGLDAVLMTGPDFGCVLHSEPVKGVPV